MAYIFLNSGSVGRAHGKSLLNPFESHPLLSLGIVMATSQESPAIMSESVEISSK